MLDGVRPAAMTEDGLREIRQVVVDEIARIAAPDNMTGAMAGLALRLDGVPKDELRYVSLLPQLLTSVGVIDNGQAVPFEQMSERLRREILSLSAGFSTNARTGRVELVLRGSGVGLDESQRALDWMQRVLQAPDWRVQNLPRIRDVVDQELAALRNTVQRAEESWVNDPAEAWRMQRNAAWLASASFLTRSYNALRLRWLLKDAAPGDAHALSAFFTQLAQAGRALDRPRLKQLLTPESAASQPGNWQSLSASQKAQAAEALRDLDLSLADMPDSSLGTDFAQLTLALRDDLLTPPREALAKLDALRQRLLRAAGARLFLAASQELGSALMPRLEAFAARLDATPFVAAPALPEGAPGLIAQRLLGRGADALATHVGLLAPNKQGGVVITSVPSVTFADAADKDKQLDYLATRLYGGGGSHALFSKTVGAGLAYSNGARGSISSGRVGYYAERTPELPQTMRFVVDIVKSGQPDATLGEYVMAAAFGESRAAQTYEARAEGIAADLADGQPPELVRRFRQSILELRRDPRLVDELFDRKDRQHARFLPGYAATGLDTRAGTYFVIGPDKQLQAWERYLQESVGPPARLQWLYGRDFWMP